MSFRCPELGKILLLWWLTVSAAPSMPLRVCADPNNLPFSNNKGEGFENKAAVLLAKDLGKDLEYYWWPQRRGFIRNTLKAKNCDVVMGVPSSFDLAATTAPYYRSTYVFLQKTDAPKKITSFDDPSLKNLRIGVHLIGDDFANVPPASALTARGMIRNVVGYPIYGDYSEPNPPARLVEAVAKGDVDLAVVWGPLAGYVVKQEKLPLTVTPVSPQIDLPYLPFVFDISLGLRRGEPELKEQLENFLTKHREELDHLLENYGVPRAG
jgi:mxaJ protein